MDIVEQLRREAARQGVTGYRLWKDSGVQVAAVQKWLDGGGLRCSSAEKLAAALGCKIILQQKGA